ncbi:hypothetical protein [Cellvibrio fibrivorans]|uniref:Glycosyltransferase RgtA/B/C/D-like domain-containing protein n=1 Tax=Cellvibrio fibrivorans TaxID=126350 RepID=A0ABU1UWN4_9GAMM|nr:hypothetical protein [Cellvibrio fibrivorans]MDR7089622.1 hypothetical protein [Cellvibrio fibrivorans]
MNNTVSGFFPRYFHNTSFTVFAFLLFGLLLWIPSLFIPFWGDDYFFLTQAREARLNGDSWWLPFVTQSQTGFWRPLSMDTGWRFVEQVLHGDVISAHIYSWCLTLVSLLAVAWFAYEFARAIQWPQPKLIALLTAAMHAVHVATYLPLHWVAAMNSPTLVFFMSATLALWIALPRLQGRVRWLALLMLPVLQLLALFSKELAILIPALVVVLAIFLRDKQSYQRADVVVLLVCVVMCLVWLYFYKEFTPSRHSAYGLTLGENLVINTLSYSAWIFNVPREALRMIVMERYLLGVAWAAACFIPMAIVYWLSIRALKPSLTIVQWLAGLAFLIIAYGPYFLLANQSYEYYAAVAIILPLLLVARALVMTDRIKIGLLLVGFSSLIAVQGTRSAAYPAVIDRAFWAERQIETLQQDTIVSPLLVRVANEHQFAAIGVRGLEWRLGLPIGSVILTRDCYRNGEKLAQRILVQNTAGDFVWEDCN